MQRRTLLRGLALGATTLAFPPFLRTAFAGSGKICRIPASVSEGEADERRRKDLARAAFEPSLERARALGKPLLVFVVPRDATLRRDRGLAFAQALTYGPPSLLAELALCELTALEMVDAPRWLQSASEPLLVLVEPDGIAFRRIDATLPREAAAHWDEPDTAYEASVEKRVQTIAGLVHEAIAPNGSVLDARARAAAAALPSAEVRAARSNAASLTPEALVRAAAIVLRDARRGAPELERRLADAVRSEQLRPEGTRWGSSYGCGVEIEGEAGGMMACGMGHVPAKGARFLHFLSRSS